MKYEFKYKSEYRVYNQYNYRAFYLATTVIQ